MLPDQAAISHLQSPSPALRGRTKHHNRPIARNLSRRARRNVAHHYDLSGDLYRLFLDSERQYTCAYFPTGSEAQLLLADTLLRTGNEPDGREAQTHLAQLRAAYIEVKDRQP